MLYLSWFNCKMNDSGIYFLCQADTSILVHDIWGFSTLLSYDRGPVWNANTCWHWLWQSEWLVLDLWMYHCNISTCCHRQQRQKLAYGSYYQFTNLTDILFWINKVILVLVYWQDANLYVMSLPSMHKAYAQWGVVRQVIAFIVPNNSTGKCWNAGPICLN